jgi:hypothetical protein
MDQRTTGECRGLARGNVGSGPAAGARTGRTRKSSSPGRHFESGRREPNVEESPGRCGLEPPAFRHGEIQFQALKDIVKDHRDLINGETLHQ